ncbi:unnamed protein product [Coregonus sp. 'balchen']|nr:unnamed protein product [Coregonus sp. 'balchen']
MDSCGIITNTDSTKWTLTHEQEENVWIWRSPLLKQYPNQAPQFLLYKGARSITWEHIPDKRHTSKTSQSSTELVITSLTLADTALYYCALRDCYDQYCYTQAEDNVAQPTENVMVVEGQQTTLTCLYDTTDRLPYLFWYKQQANGKPMFMLRKDTVGVGETAAEFKERFHARLNVTAKSVPLMIQRVQLSDSAVYYCALKPTVTVMVRPAYPGNLILLIMDGVGSTSQTPANLNDEKNRVDLEISSAEVTDSALYYCALRPTVTGNPETLQYCDTSEDDITSTSPEEYFIEGSRVKLSCNYTVKADSLLWYRQYSGSVRGHPQDLQLSVTLNKERTRVDLEISSAEVTDTTLYYCALKPTVTGNSETEHGMEGSSVTLFCNYSGSAKLIYTTVTSNLSVFIAKPEELRLSVNLTEERTRVDLEISSAEVTDSALYYCALSVEAIITPDRDIVDVMEGSSVKLSCRYNSSLTNSLLWYRQHPGSSPQFLTLDYSGTITNTDSTKWTLTQEKEDNSVDLEISSAEVTDSALDYCALKPTVTGNPEKSVSFEDDINPTRSIVGGVEGDTITLSCSYTGSVDNLQLYHQYPRSKPEFLILITKSGYVQKPVPPRMSAQVHTDCVDLEISSAEVTDFALYYCALRPTVTGKPEPLHKNTNEVISTEGELVTLSCSFNTSSEYPRLYWYRHYPNQAPQFLLYKGARSSTSKHIPGKRYTSKTSQTSTELVIRSLTLADTVLYYCALRDYTQ